MYPAMHIVQNRAKNCCIVPQEAFTKKEVKVQKKIQYRER